MHTGTVITLIDFLSDSLSEVDLFLWLFFFFSRLFLSSGLSLSTALRGWFLL